MGAGDAGKERARGDGPWSLSPFACCPTGGIGKGLTLSELPFLLLRNSEEPSWGCGEDGRCVERGPSKQLPPAPHGTRGGTAAGAEGQQGGGRVLVSPSATCVARPFASVSSPEKCGNNNPPRSAG